MEICCNKPFTFCTPIDPCFYLLAVRIPASYQNAFVTLQFKKQSGSGVGFKIDCEIVDGWALVDIEAVPDGFFSFYGGPYFCQFISTSDYQPVLFSIAGVSDYDGFYFSLSNLVQQGGYSQVNIFDSEIYVNP